MKLQVNTSGAWRNVVDFDKARKQEVVDAVRSLDAALGERVKWCLVQDDDSREWLNLRAPRPRALPRIDFTQGHLNGYRPGEPNECYCFDIDRGRYCGRGKAWPGHGTLHEFVAEQVPR